MLILQKKSYGSPVSIKMRQSWRAYDYECKRQISSSDARTSYRQDLLTFSLTGSFLPPSRNIDAVCPEGLFSTIFRDIASGKIGKDPTVLVGAVNLGRGGHVAAMWHGIM